MSERYAATKVSVALVTNAAGDNLWVWDDEWGCFALPMIRPKMGASEFQDLNDAAARAAAKALALPIVVGQHIELEPELFIATRDQTMRKYRYRIYRVEVHPDFADTPPARGSYLWLPPHRALSRDYQPLSPSCQWIVATLVKTGLIPGRSQYTAALVLHRKHLEKHQFLLRLEPGWGYTLPTKRRLPTETYATAAERVLQSELGVDPANLSLEAATESVVSTRDISHSEQTITFYCHGVYMAEVPDGLAFKSTRPLVWADAKTIVSGQVHGLHTIDDHKAPDAKISPTARQILAQLDLVPKLPTSLV